MTLRSRGSSCCYFRVHVYEYSRAHIRTPIPYYRHRSVCWTVLPTRVYRRVKSRISPMTPLVYCRTRFVPYERDYHIIRYRNNVRLPPLLSSATRLGVFLPFCNYHTHIYIYTSLLLF